MESLSPGQKVTNSQGREGYVFSMHEDSTKVNVLYEGASKPVVVNSNFLNQPKSKIPTATSVVMYDYNGPGGNIFAVIGRVKSMAKQLMATTRELEDYSSKIIGGKVGDYNACLLYSVKFLQSLGLQ